MIVESSLRRFRNGGVTGKITRAVVQKKGNSNKNTGKELVRTGKNSDKRNGAWGRDNNSLNKRQSLKGKYRRRDIMRWVNEN